METLSRRPTMRFWGWGYETEKLEEATHNHLVEVAEGLAGCQLSRLDSPRVEDFELPAPRIEAPASLRQIMSGSPYDRLTHSYGKSFADMARMLGRDVSRPPDLVAFPRDEQTIADLLDWAANNAVAVIPFGGGSSVCGGVEPVVGDAYRGCVSLDLQYLNQIVEIDHVSRAARIQAGIFGPELEEQLRPHDLTLRHFPQSFQFSTLGGWIATRAGGHYATLYTHIDDFVESTRTITTKGALETRRLPGSGAGPSADRLIIGSEGTLGVITEAWMRLQDRPVYKASESLHFAEFSKAVAAIRALSQSALFPSNCRLLDPMEAKLNGLGDGSQSWLVLGFESADHPVDAWMARALELASDHGGVPRREESAEQGVASRWRNAFLEMPYYRNETTRLGLIADTFETAITWDKFENLYQGVKNDVGKVIERVTGKPSVLSCRFTHVYPDGPAPYFTFYAVGSSKGDMVEVLARWQEIKLAANDAVVRYGGTITHHHAVGRDHRDAYLDQSAPLFQSALAAAKSALDPNAIMNPGVLLDPTA